MEWDYYEHEIQGPTNFDRKEETLLIESIYNYNQSGKRYILKYNYTIMKLNYNIWLFKIFYFIFWRGTWFSS